METRIFDGPDTVISTDGSYLETFVRGERVKYVQRIGKRVVFEPVSAHRIAGTYVMNWAEFEALTSAVREAES
jgi:hypothetical protein